MSVTVVTQVQRVVVRGSGASYSDARVLAYLRSILTTNGDLLTVAAGTLARVGVGSSGQVLTVSGGAAVWAAPTGMANPMSAHGDLIIGGASGSPTRLPRGTNGQILSVSGSTLAWIDPVTQYTDADAISAIAGEATDSQLFQRVNANDVQGISLSTIYDGAIDAIEALGNGVQVTVAGALTQIAPTTEGRVLGVSGGVWAEIPAPGGFANPMTTLGDLITGGVSGAPGRLGIGTEGYVLRVVSGVPAWGADVGFANPMTTDWDIIRGGSSGAATRLALGPPQTAPVSSGGTLSYELVRPVAVYSALAAAIGEWSSITLRGTTSGGTTADAYGTFRQRSGANVATGVEIAGNVGTDLNRDIEITFMLDTALPGASVGTIWVGAGGVTPTTQAGFFRAQIQWSGSGNYTTRFAAASPNVSTPVDLGFAPVLNQLVRVVIRLRQTYAAIQCYDGVTGAALSSEVRETDTSLTPIGSGTTIFGAFALLNSGSAGITSGMRLYTGQTRVLG